MQRNTQRNTHNTTTYGDPEVRTYGVVHVGDGEQWGGIWKGVYKHHFGHLVYSAPYQDEMQAMDWARSMYMADQSGQFGRRGRLA